MTVEEIIKKINILRSEAMWNDITFNENEYKLELGVNVLNELKKLNDRIFITPGGTGHGYLAGIEIRFVNMNNIETIKLYKEVK